MINYATDEVYSYMYHYTSFDISSYLEMKLFFTSLRVKVEQSRGIFLHILNKINIFMFFFLCSHVIHIVSMINSKEKF